MTSEEVTSEHILYRLFDATNELLYVGITNNTSRRFSQHARKQPWWSDVASSRTEFYRSRAELEVAELTAIRIEKPIHNAAYNYRTAVSSSESARSYASVALTPAARDALRAATIELTSPLGRRVSMSEVLIATMKLSARDPNELLARITRTDSPAHALPTGRAGHQENTDSRSMKCH